MKMKLMSALLSAACLMGAASSGAGELRAFQGVVQVSDDAEVSALDADLGIEVVLQDGPALLAAGKIEPGSHVSVRYDPADLDDGGKGKGHIGDIEQR